MPVSGIVIGKSRYWLAVLLAMPTVTGCGYIKSLFPDKERDYQFRTEIPELVVPEDLKGKTLPETTPEQMAAAAVSAAESESVTDEKSMPADEPRGEASITEAQPDSPVSEASDPAVPVASRNPAVSSLQIDQPQKQAWRLVARALNRQRMEIVERNIDKGYFYVNYDPHATKPEDGSLWDEVTFLFGDDPSDEKEYRITLQQIAPQVTEVTVQDSSGTTISNDVATALLKLITDGINQALPEKTQDDSAEGASTEKVQENSAGKSAPEKAEDQPTEPESTENTQENAVDKPFPGKTRDNPSGQDAPEQPRDSTGDSVPAL